MAGVVRHFGKNILITDREDWGVEEIYDTCVTRAVLGTRDGRCQRLQWQPALRQRQR